MYINTCNLVKMSATSSQLLVFTSVLAVALCGVFVFTAWTLNTSHRHESDHLWSEVRRLRQIVENSDQGKDSLSPQNRINRRSADMSSATGLLVDALNELIEKKLYTLMECNRNDQDNQTDCSLKPGPKGEKGNTGKQGKDGLNGIQGFEGQRGQPGYPGFKGDVGPQGPAGVRGLKGDPGSVGGRGAPGPVGRQGMPGAAGPRGGTGQKGEKGYLGHTGFRGEAGPKGDPGMRGPLGYAGERGRTGATGPPGHSGHKGEKGQKGETGNEQQPDHGCPGGGWREVVSLNMADPNQYCPSGLQLTNQSIRTCGKVNTELYTCDSVTFPVSGQYREVCGRAKAFQFGWSIGFFGYNTQQRNLDDQYLDGLSITHGSPREHIWSFVAGVWAHTSGRVGDRHRCPCVGGDPSPPFVGSDYFCDSVTTADNWNNRVFRPNNALWDGVDSADSCYDQPGVPWFTKKLPNATSDDIELRMCFYYPPHASDIGLQELSIYVRE